MLEMASHWGACEVVPENWNPSDPADVAALTALNKNTNVLLHSLSLNVLGPAPPAPVVRLIREWADVLGINMITDHFCWSATDDHALGVFVPPVDDVATLKARVRAMKRAVGMTFGLENISLSADDPEFCTRYHRALAQISRDEGVAVLLDLENLRLDSFASGLPMAELLSLYDDVEICGYHVAGSTLGDPVLDTHDQRVPEETLQALLICLKGKPGPVIYERDYALDLAEIGDEVARIAAFVESGGRRG